MLFLYGRWLELPITTRVQIADRFGIIKRGSTEVFENRIVNDGYVITEIEGALNIDALQKYLAVEDTDMLILWDKMLARIEGREYEPPAPEVVPEPIPAVKPPFCDQCDSKGGAHKKLCPKRNK